MKKQDIIKEVESYINGKYNLGIIDDKIVKECINKTLEAINYTRCSLELPSKDEITSEGEKQIIEWLEGNTDLEKKHYRVAFRRSFEYVLRRLKD